MTPHRRFPACNTPIARLLILVCPSNGPATNTPFCTSHIWRARSSEPVTTRRASLKNVASLTTSMCPRIVCLRYDLTGDGLPLTERYVFLAMSTTADMSCGLEKAINGQWYHLTQTKSVGIRSCRGCYADECTTFTPTTQLLT